MEMLGSLGYELVDGLGERLGPEGLGRDDQSQVVLRHRLRPKLVELNPDLPEAAIDGAVEELMRDRSALGSTQASRAVYGLLRDGVKVTFTDDSGDRAEETVRVVDWEAPEQQRVPCCQPALGGRPAPHAALRHRLLRQRDSAGADGVEGLPQERRAGVPQEPQRLPRHDPAAVRAERASSCSRTGRRRRWARRSPPWERFGEWKRIDDESRARGRLAGDGDPRHLRAGAAARHRRELRRLHGAARAGWSRSLAQNHQVLGVNAAMRALARSAAARRASGSACSGTRRARARACRCCCSPRRCCAAMPGNWTFVMVTDRAELDDQLHGEFDDAGAVAERHVQATSSAAPARAARRGPPLRLHADPQVPPRARARRDAGAARIATT